MVNLRKSASTWRVVGAGVSPHPEKHERIRPVTAKLYPVTTETETREAIEAAREALKAHDTIVMPTDTVYGIAADAFSHQALPSCWQIRAATAPCRRPC